MLIKYDFWTRRLFNNSNSTTRSNKYLTRAKGTDVIYVLEQTIVTNVDKEKKERKKKKKTGSDIYIFARLNIWTA